ncbi:MAG: ATP-binding protein [Pseudomonadota bacterium]
MSRPLRPDPPLQSLIEGAGDQLNSLMQAMPGWMWETDASHHFTYVSDNRALIRGGPNDSPGNSRLENFRALADHGEPLNGHIQDMLDHRPFRNFVYRLEAEDGKTPWMCTSGDPCYTPDGTFVGYQGFAMLVTPIMDAAERSIEAERELLRRNAMLERKVAERTRELEAANALLAHVVEGMDHGVLAFNGGPLEDQRVMLANKRLADMIEVPEDLVRVGARREALHLFCKARGDFDSIPPDEVALLLAPRGEARMSKFRRFLPSGRAVHSLATHADSGTIVATFTDVSDLNAREQELEAARAAAVAADRAKSEFLANMSHEIRTPMNGVLGIAELMRTTDLDERQQSYADVIVQSGATLMTILNDILDFSKIDAGHLTLEAAPFRLDKTVMDVTELMQAAAGEKGLKLCVGMPADLPGELIGDRARIRQILTNLIGNAVKFTDRGEVRVEVSREVSRDDAEQILVQVIDTGIGIPADKIETIFENFTQVDSTSTRRHKGTGLGLAISRRLVTLMGGEIGARSALGQGSTVWFRLTLPLSCSSTASPSAASA